MIHIHLPPAPTFKLRTPVVHQTTRTYDENARVPAVIIGSSYLPHTFGISFIAGFTKGSREESNHLDCLTKAHVIPKDASSLIDEKFMQKFSTLNLIVSKPLCHGCWDHTSRILQYDVLVRGT